MEKEFKFSKKQQAAYDKCTNMQRKIVINIVHTKMSNRASYYEAGGKAKNHTSADSTVTQILRKPQVKAFLGSLMEQEAGSAIMNREEILKRLSSIGRTSITDVVDFQNIELSGSEELANSKRQSIWHIKDLDNINPEHAASISEVTAGREGLKIKMRCPISAMGKIVDMQGYAAPERHEHSGPGGKPIETKSMSDEELARKIAFILTKAASKKK